MRTLIRFAILMSAIICADSFAGPQSAFAQEKIHWQTNPQQAAHQAAQENKLVLLHFTAEWCGPCQTQKRFVFSNPGVARAVNQSVIPVLVDIDVNRELAGELGVKSVPFDVFLTPGGEVVSKRRSPSDSHNFIKMVSSTRTVGTAPKSGALAKLAKLKRKFDPMSLPKEQRADFGVEAPEPATLGVSKEAMGLGARSNYGDQMTFQKRKSTGSAQDGVNSDLQSVFGSIEQREKMQEFDHDPRSEQSNPFFEIPEKRTEQARSANIPAAGKMVNNPMMPQPGQRSYENMQRQEFLARERDNIEFPSQPTDVQPVRVMNENFLAAAKSEFGSNSLKPSSILPGLAVSDMVDARTGRSIAPTRNSGRSIARFKPTNPEPLPSNKFRIVPHKENRIAGHAVDSSFASQATLKRDAPASMAELSVSGTASAEPNSVASNQMAAESNTLDSQTDAGESDFCLKGKCPVALALEGKWVDGDARWGIVHRDRTYLFSSEENYRRFQQQPDLYSPVLAAYDPVAFHDSGKFVDGLEKNGVFMEKDEHQQIVLFSTEENRQKFQTNPHLYLRSVRKAIFTASRVDVPGSAADTNFR